MMLSRRQLDESGSHMIASLNVAQQVLADRSNRIKRADS